MASFSCSINSQQQAADCEVTYAEVVKRVKGRSPKKRQKQEKQPQSSSPSLCPEDFNLEAVVGKGGFGQVSTALVNSSTLLIARHFLFISVRQASSPTAPQAESN